MYRSVPFMSPTVRALSIARPSTWLKYGRSVASGGPRRQAWPLAPRAPRGQRRWDGFLCPVGRRAEPSPLRRPELAYARQQAAELPARAPEIRHLDRLELGRGLRLGNGRERLTAERGWIAHAASLRLISKRMTAAAAATLNASTPSKRGTRTSLTSFP